MTSRLAAIKTNSWKFPTRSAVFLAHDSAKTKYFQLIDPTSGRAINRNKVAFGKEEDRDGVEMNFFRADRNWTRDCASERVLPARCIIASAIEREKDVSLRLSPECSSSRLVHRDCLCARWFSHRAIRFLFVNPFSVLQVLALFSLPQRFFVVCLTKSKMKNLMSRLQKSTWCGSCNKARLFRYPLELENRSEVLLQKL